MEFSKIRFAGIAFLLVLVQALILYALGQPATSATHSLMLWAGDIHSSENSQQLSDWYTFSHVIHGFIFYFLLSYFFPKAPTWKRFLGAMLIEEAWEILENTPMVINHYRLQALAQGYVGDSVVNSVSDTIAMMLGFLVAWRAPILMTVSVAIGFELFTAYWVHDGLFFNVLGFVWRPEFISRWQAGV